MSVVYQIAITLVGWFAIMFISTNLIGLLMRGVANPEFDEIESYHEIIAKDYRKHNNIGNIIAMVLIGIFFCILYYFWNIYLVISAFMLMLSRAPVVSSEIKAKHVFRLDIVQNPILSALWSLLSWGSLPVVWFSLFRS
jgi:hypothetical protein